MNKIGEHLLGGLFILMTVFCIGFGVFILRADAVWMSAIGLPLEVTGLPKALLGVFCFLPASLLVWLFVAMRSRQPLH